MALFLPFPFWFCSGQENTQILPGQAGDVWPGEEKAAVRISCSLSGPAGDREGLLERDGVYEVGAVALN